jgi:hypothetical protein
LYQLHCHFNFSGRKKSGRPNNVPDIVHIGEDWLVSIRDSLEVHERLLLWCELTVEGLRKWKPDHKPVKKLRELIPRERIL